VAAMAGVVQGKTVKAGSAGQALGPRAGAVPSDAIVPDKVIKLFNGRDLSGWTTWLVDTKRKDPRGVYSVQHGAIRISGDGFGYLATRKAYRNYRLVAEVKWGERNYRTRKGMARDSGIFLHSVGPDGNSYDCGWGARRRNTGPDISSGAYTAAIECQVMEGSFGGILLIHGRYADGRDVPVRVTMRVVRYTGAPGPPGVRFDPCGEPKSFTRGWLHWQGRDPNWKDVLGFRGRGDVESPHGQWTRIECICDGSHITILINGKRVNEAYDVFPNAGRILLQCEGSEVFFRNIELHPLQKGKRMGTQP